MNDQVVGGGDKKIQLPVRIVVFVWIASYLVASIVAAVVVGSAGYGDTKTADQPLWLIGLTSLALWVPMLFALLWVSGRYGSGKFQSDYALRFKPKDLIGVPIGIASQLILVPIVTWPFTQIWPDSFSTEKVEQRARDLYDTASGGWIVLLVVIVVFGAPLVEELMYRGFIQRATSKQLGVRASVIVTAVWFTLVHMQPVEFPGLFCFALILGFLTLQKGTIGSAVWAHIAFNATGLLLIATL